MENHALLRVDLWQAFCSLLVVLRMMQRWRGVVVKTCLVLCLHSVLGYWGFARGMGTLVWLGYSLAGGYKE